MPGAGVSPAATDQGDRLVALWCLTRGWAFFLGLASILVASAAHAAGTDPVLPPGVVVDRVTCTANRDQTYALFLPSTYGPDRSWPILYAFDPGARGRVPVQLFSQAAERLGLIVVGSNNSRNGPFPPVRAAIEAVWRDTHERFAIDPERVYTAGMSGATQPAVLLGAAQGAGVISCAGPLDTTNIPSGELRFTWIGIAGDADFNYERTRGLVDALVARRVVARFATFAGGHGWPPEDLLAKALGWLDLASMRTGKKAPDPAFVEATYEQGVARSHELAEKGLLDDAAEENAALAREFAGLRPVDACASEAKRLAATPEAARDREQRRALAERERNEGGELSGLRRKLEDGEAWHPRSGARLSEMTQFDEDLRAGRDALHRRLDKLARDMASATDPSDRILAQRLLDGFWLRRTTSARSSGIRGASTPPRSTSVFARGSGPRARHRSTRWPVLTPLAATRRRPSPSFARRWLWVSPILPVSPTIPSGPRCGTGRSTRPLSRSCARRRTAGRLVHRAGSTAASRGAGAVATARW